MSQSSEHIQNSQKIQNIQTSENLYFAKLLYETGGTGFTNQMLGLTASIVKAILTSKRAVVLDYFGLSYNSKETTNISNIVDLQKTNAYLKEKYNIILIDKNNMNFKLHKAYYGVMISLLDLTSEISKYIKDDNRLFIPQSLELNSLKGDPYIGYPKHFCFYYSLNEHNFMDNYKENLPYDIDTNPPTELCKYDFESSFFQIRAMPEIFNDIFKNIHFTNDVTPVSLLNHNIFKIHDKVNVIHIRVEDDATAHWGRQNQMTPNQFKEYIENKYIELIQKYIQKNELTIVLTYSPDNSVVEYMKTQGYTYLYVKKDLNKNTREIDAIHDLLLSTKCNNVFIGNFWMKKLEGSAFSYYIIQKLQYPNVKKVSICLDNIKEPEDVFY